MQIARDILFGIFYIGTLIPIYIGNSFVLYLGNGVINRDALNELAETKATIRSQFELFCSFILDPISLLDFP
jgi:hypothetical protein